MKTAAAATSALAGITTITFDAGGTILWPQPSVGAVYREVILRHGGDGETAALETAFRAAFIRVSKSQLLLDPEARERDFWRRVVRATLAAAGTAPPDFDGFFADLWETFAHGDRWRVHPHAATTLRRLRVRGYRLAVLSNWDRRLHRVLEETGLRPWFDAVLISSEVGAEKPDAGIFRAAERALAATPDQCLHIGDSRPHDLEGAAAAGWRAFLVARDDESLDHHPGMIHLADLPALLPGGTPPGQ